MRIWRGRGRRALAIFAACAAFADVKLVDGVLHEGHASVRVETPTAAWIYHKEGGGFAALIDAEGNDWITWRPGNGSAGEFRGIPNFGVTGHPGYTGAKGVVTSAAQVNAKLVRIESRSESGGWEWRWEIYEDRAELTIVKAGASYWFLYEGTPGGKLDVDTDYYVLPGTGRRAMSDIWNADIDGPEWVYFGDQAMGRAIFLINHQDDKANEQFWQMQGNMTVWGFGREYRCCGRYMAAAPARFTVGLAAADTVEAKILELLR